MLEFKEYLHSKKIDSDAFVKAEGTQYDYLKNYFDQVSPSSFTAQKLFLINDLRRKYLYKEIVVENKQEIIVTTSDSQVISKPVLARPSVAGVKIPAKPIVKQTDNNDGAVASAKPNIPARPKIPGVKIPVKPVVEKEGGEKSNEVQTNSSTVAKPNIPARPKIPGVKIPVKAIIEKEEAEKSSEIKGGTSTVAKSNIPARPKIPGLKPPEKAEEPEDKEEVKPKAALAPKIPSLRPKIPPKKAE
jgi:hypothetical protein